MYYRESAPQPSKGDISIRTLERPLEPHDMGEHSTAHPTQQRLQVAPDHEKALVPAAARRPLTKGGRVE